MQLHQGHCGCSGSLCTADSRLPPHLSQLRVIHNCPVAAEILLEGLEHLFVVNALLQALQVACAVSTFALLRGCNRTLPACYIAWRQTLQTFSKQGASLARFPVPVLPATSHWEACAAPNLYSICSFPLAHDTIPDSSPARSSDSSCRCAAECGCAHNPCCCLPRCPRLSRRLQKDLQKRRRISATSAVSGRWDRRESCSQLLGNTAGNKTSPWVA